ncbi:MAG: hypothetical protein RLZZ501_959, partial [Pseudomonadota bacterium]
MKRAGSARDPAGAMPRTPFFFGKRGEVRRRQPPGGAGAPAPRGLLRAAVPALASRLLDLPSRYGFHLLVAAGLGMVAAGDFYIVFSLMVALAGLGRLGLDRALTREVAIALAAERPGQARRLVGRALGLVGLLSGGLTLALALAAEPLARLVLHRPELAEPLALGALAILPQNLSTVAAGGLAGLRRI